MASGEWEWQARFTLAEQLRRIADNLISKRVEQWNRRPQEQVIVLMDLNVLDEALAETDEEQSYDPEKLRIDRQVQLAYDDEDEMDDLYERVLDAVKGDEELERYVLAIRECNDLDDMCEILGINKKQAYNLNKRLMRKLKRA